MAVSLDAAALVSAVNGLTDATVAARLLAVVTELVEIEFSRRAPIDSERVHDPRIRVALSILNQCRDAARRCGREKPRGKRNAGIWRAKSGSAVAGSAAMISLGLRADPKVVETRESYTDQILTGLFTMASGGSSLGSAMATAALEAGAGRIARAMASATTPHPAITPALLHDITHKLVVSGSAVYDLAVDSTRGLRFVPAASCDITGGADPESWVYRLTVNGPSQTYSATRPRAAVAHFQWQQHPLYPWKSLGPVQPRCANRGAPGQA